MKVPIAWYQNCLISNRAYLAQLMRERAERIGVLDKQIETTRIAMDLLEKQIRVAIAEHREGFDRDKFLIPRRKRKG